MTSTNKQTIKIEASGQLSEESKTNTSVELGTTEGGNEETEGVQ